MSKRSGSHLAHRWARYSVQFEPDDGDTECVDPVMYAGELPAEFFGVNRILQRWAVSVSGGMQTEVWDDSGVARPPPLDEPHAYIIDRIVCKLPRRRERLLTYWYRKNIGIKQIKKKLHIRTSVDLYQELSSTLQEVVSLLRACDSLSLIQLLEIKS